MKINITYWLVLKYLLLSFLIKSQNNIPLDSSINQSSTKNYNWHLADSLYETANYNYAAIEYERIYFFSKDTLDKIKSLLNRSECFYNTNENEKAYNSLVRVFNYNLNDSVKAKMNYKIALNLYLSKFFNDAEKYCAKNYSLPINTNDYKNSIFLHALILNELNNYTLAKNKLLAYCNEINYSNVAKDSLKMFINTYYSKGNIPKLKSVKKARRLSKCLPGAGLFYVGKPGKALVNISLQLVAVGYTAANVYFQNYFTSATIGVFLIRMFYTGGVNQLNEIVPKVNYLKTRKFNNSFKTNFVNLINHYETIKN